MKKLAQYNTNIVILFILIIVILSTTGLETNHCRLISNKLSPKKILFGLNAIKFKINPTKLILFLETKIKNLI